MKGFCLIDYKTELLPSKEAKNRNKEVIVLELTPPIWNPQFGGYAIKKNPHEKVWNLVNLKTGSGKRLQHCNSLTNMPIEAAESTQLLVHQMQF